MAQKTQQVEVYEEVSWPKMHQDIIEGKVENIYTSQRSFWWTHTIDDARYFEPKPPPKKLMRKNAQDYARLQSLYLQMKEQWDQGIKHPYDPEGVPLMQREARVWLTWIEEQVRKGYMGPLGRKAVMVCHAQNSNIMMKTVMMANEIVGKTIVAMAREQKVKPDKVTIYGV